MGDFAAALIFTSCTPAGVETPTTAPVATLQCHGELIEEAHPCEQAEYEAMPARDAQYEEAEAIYREAVALRYSLRASRDSMDAELGALVTGSLGEGLREDLNRGRESETEFRGQPQMVWFKRANLSDQGSALALEVCTAPGTAHTIVDGRVTPAPFAREQVFFTTVDSRLRVSSNRYAVVNSCDA